MKIGSIGTAINSTVFFFVFVTQPPSSNSTSLEDHKTTSSLIEATTLPVELKLHLDHAANLTIAISPRSTLQPSVPRPITTRQALPDLTKPADPSLYPITLNHPDYRPLTVTAPSTEKEQPKSSSTIMEMNDDGEGRGSTSITASDTTIATMSPTTTASISTSTAAEETTTDTAQAMQAQAAGEAVAEKASATTEYTATTEATTEAVTTEATESTTTIEEGETTTLGGGVPLLASGNRPFYDPKRTFYNPPNYGGSPALSAANPGVVGPIIPQIGLTVPAKETLIDVDILNNRLRLNKKIKLLDASYEPEGNTVDPTTFQDLYYGNWDKLMKEKKGLQYVRSHIPGAIHFNLNVGTYPTWNDKQALYPADLFQEYVQLLGINRTDEIVVYSRGPMGGMLHAARVWAIFRIYGHEKISILNGGLDAWRRADLPTNDDIKGVEQGNWVSNYNPTLVVTFEELTSTQADGYCVFSRLYWYNFLDARPRNEFFGFFGNRLFGPQKSRIPGTKSFPADELIRSDGFFATSAEILQKLQNIGFLQSRQSIVAGNSADEASIVILALKLIGENRARLYNGGLEEIRRRAPQFISAR